MNEWMNKNEWMDGWMDGWMNGWIDKTMNGQIWQWIEYSETGNETDFMSFCWVPQILFVS